MTGSPGERVREVAERGLMAGDLGGLGEEPEHRLSRRRADALAGAGAEPRHVQARVGGVAERAHRDRGHAEALAGEARRRLVPDEVGAGIRAADRIGVTRIVLEREAGPPGGPGQQGFVEAHAERGDADQQHVGVHVPDQIPGGVEDRRGITVCRYVGRIAGRGESNRSLAGRLQQIEGRSARRDPHLEARVGAQGGTERPDLGGAAGIARGDEDANRPHGLARPAATTASASAQSSGVSMSIPSIVSVGSGRSRGGKSRRCVVSAARVTR